MARNARNYNEDSKDESVKRSGKGRNTRRRNKKQIEKDVNIDKEKKLNDPNWYFESPVLMDQVARISMNQFLGQKDYASRLSIPNIVTLFVHPSPGICDAGDQTAGINVAGQKLYAQLSAFTGRTSTYAPQDISTLMLALGEVISLTSFIRRVFGTVNVYNQKNRSVPENLIKAMGVDYDDLTANCNDYIKRFNAIMTIANKIVFPVNIAYLAKCNDMYNYVYMDRDDQMAQLIIFKPASTWLLDESSNPNGSVLVTTSLIPGSGQPLPDSTMKSWLDLLQNMINILLTSSTLNIIYSDIRNLATKLNVPLIALPLIDSGYTVTPVYNEGVLEQLHNATWYGSPQPDTNPAFITGCTNENDVLPDPNTNTVYHRPCVSVTTANYPGMTILKRPDYVLDFFDSNPSAERIIEATRYIVSLDATKFNSVGTDRCIAMGSTPDHFISQVSIFYNDVATAGTSPHYDYLTSSDNYMADSSNMPRNVSNFIAGLSAIRHAPAITNFRVDNITTPTTYTDYGRRYGELTGFTLVDESYLKSTNDIITLSLFGLR